MADGLDLDALSGYLAPFSGPAPALRAELIEGGKSNLTYRLTDGSHDWCCADRRSDRSWQPLTTWPASIA